MVHVHVLSTTYTCSHVYFEVIINVNILTLISASLHFLDITKIALNKVRRIFVLQVGNDAYSKMK